MKNLTLLLLISLPLLGGDNPPPEVDGLMTRLTLQPEKNRKAALESLPRDFQNLTPEGKKALISALIVASGDLGVGDGSSNVGPEAQEALIVIGSPAVPELVRTLKDPAGEVVTREQVARVLGRIRPVARETVSLLISLLGTERKSPPRPGIAFALGEIGIRSADVVGALESALAYRYPDIPDGGVDLNSYTEIAFALKKLGKEHKGALDVLGRFLERVNVWERIQAAGAILRLAPGHPEALQTLRSVIRSRQFDGDLCDYLFRNLRTVGPPAAPLVPDLVALLDDKDVSVDRVEAARTLREIGTPAALDAAKKLESRGNSK